VTGLIKSGAPVSATRVRALADGHDLAPPPRLESDDERARNALEQTVADLGEALSQRGHEIERLHARVTEAYEEGETAGRILGRAEAEDAAERGLAVLSDAVDRALAAFTAEIASLDRLAPLIAREGLGKILGDPDLYGELLTSSLQHALKAVEAGSIVHVEVSAADFAEADLVVLAARLNVGDARVAASPHAAAGSCTVKLRLGALEVGVDQQWGELDALLRAAAEPEARA